MERNQPKEKNLLRSHWAVFLSTPRAQGCTLLNDFVTFEGWQVWEINFSSSWLAGEAYVELGKQVLHELVCNQGFFAWPYDNYPRGICSYVPC